MSVEEKGIPDGAKKPPHVERPKIKAEKHRLIAHLGRTFARRYDMDVLPSGQKGLWACSLDPKVLPEINKYIEGERETLDDLPPEAFVPKQILYDAETAQEMEIEDINAVLHHEAGHAKYTNFKLMFEGQRAAKDEGHLPTSFWLTWEGIEDPRISNLEGEESPAIDRQIKAYNSAELQKRITEKPLKDKPQMLQFAYESLHRWLHEGEGIPELKGTEVGKIADAAQPLLSQYFENIDPEQRKLLQKQIWDLAKPLEKIDIEDEKKRQMAQKMGKKGKSDQGQGQGQPQGSGQEQRGQGVGSPSILGGKEDGSKQNQGVGKGFLDRLKSGIFGQRKDTSKEESGGSGESTEQDKDQKDNKNKEERVDLSKLSKEDLQEISDAIDNLTPEEKAELSEKSREAIDEMQKEIVEEEMSKFMKLEKNKKTGEYEAKVRNPSEGQKEQGKKEFDEAVKKVDAEDRAELERQEEGRRLQQEILQKLDIERREKMEMEKAGFDENEREKFLLYQGLEDGMYSQTRVFRQAIEKVIPRKKEGVYESGFFSGPKFNRRDLVRKAPIGDERFHMRQVERPIGEPRLFIGLIVDDSGSMKGKKMEEARKTVIFFAKACRDMGIPFMVSAFGNDAQVIKQFRQDFDNPAERIKPKIIDATEANPRNNTNLHAGVDITIKAMNEERRKLRDSHGLIFVITDGGANLGLTGQALKNYIEENRGRLTFKAFGFPGTETFLNEYFGESNCVYPKGFEDLPGEAFRLLRTTLIQFQRYLH